MAPLTYLTSAELQGLGLRSCGRDVRISRDARIYGASAVSIGDHVRIDDFTVISGREAVRIGRNVHIAQFCGLYGGAGLELEDFSGLSSRVAIYTQSDDYSGEAMTNPTVPTRFRAVKAGPVRVGRHAIIGSGAVVMPGVSLGDGSAVGALSLVTRDVKAWTIVAGVPARLLKTRSQTLLAFESEYLEMGDEDVVSTA